MSPTKYRLYAVMVFMNFLNAWYDSIFGPIIPYFSAATGLDQTDYSYLFLVRVTANILGGFLVKFLIKRVSTQTLALVYMTAVMFSLYASTLSLSNVNLTVTLFIATGAFIGISVITYSTTIKLFLQDEPEYWVQMLEFFYVVGALSGQFFVVMFGIQSLKVMGVANLLPIIAIIVYPLPDVNDSDLESEGKGAKMSRKSVVFISLICLCFATLEMGVASWMPTYAIKAAVTDVKGSTLFSMLFWGSNCIVKMAWIYLPVKIEKKLGLSLKLGLFAALLTVLFQQLSMLELVSYFSPISVGILISGVYGFCHSLVVDEGFAFCPSVNATFVLANVIGEGLFITLMGYAMGLFGFQSLIIAIGLFSLCAVFAFLKAVKSMDEDKNQYKILFPEEDNNDLQGK